jgi:hypothetical protein
MSERHNSSWTIFDQDYTHLLELSIKQQEERKGAPPSQDFMRMMGEMDWRAEQEIIRMRGERMTAGDKALGGRLAGSQRFHELLEEIGALHDKKQADYGKDTDPFANVRASDEWGLAPWVGAMIRLNDKVKRLQTFARKGSLKNESAKDSMLDIAVYALIAYVLYEQGGGE